MVITPQCTVKMHYTLSLDNDSELESTLQSEPIEFVYGEGNLIPGLENELEGMAKGEKKQVTVAPKEAYGDKNPDAVVTVPRDKFPTEEKLEPGAIFKLSQENGQIMHATVVEVNEKELTLDMNHPLAGQALRFDVEIVEITAPES